MTDMDSTAGGTAVPGTGPQTAIPIWPLVSEDEARSRITRAVERIADALEAQNMAGPQTKREWMDMTSEAMYLAARQKEGK